MLSANELLTEARRLSGLDNYGDMSFKEGLEVLVKSTNEEAGLTAEHEALFKQQLLRVLVNRLRMEQDLSRHPEILDEEILPPVFITSLPRTGSTKLHRLLAATGGFNSMTFWHADNFAPFPGSEGVVPDPRIAAAEEHLQWIYRKAPEFQRYHPMYAEETEEELGLLDAGFNSLYQYAVFLNIPGYVHWILSRDGSQVFRDLRRMLQYLQWQHHRGRKRRWVLKTPSMFGFEAAFAAGFPGTDFVVTHRHPEQFMASACCLYRGCRQQYSDEDFTLAAGEIMLYNFSETLKGHLHWRSQYPAEKVMDVRFGEVTGDEVALVKRIFSFLKMPFSADNEAGVRAWITMDSKRGHQVATATLEDFGLKSSVIEERLADYFKNYADFL